MSLLLACCAVCSPLLCAQSRTSSLLTVPNSCLLPAHSVRLLNQSVFQEQLFISPLQKLYGAVPEGRATQQYRRVSILRNLRQPQPFITSAPATLPSRKVCMPPKVHVSALNLQQTTAPFALEALGKQCCHQRRARRRGLVFGQEPVTPSLLLLVGNSGDGQCTLPHA